MHKRHKKVLTKIFENDIINELSRKEAGQVSTLKNEQREKKESRYGGAERLCVSKKNP
jgi:hypothetical protein